MKANKRVLVSYDGLCPYGCKHCYTFELDQNESRSIDQIVSSLEGKAFDIVYVSQKKENFVNPDEGILLCEKIFTKYKCSIVAITRNVFNYEQVKRLASLSKRMKQCDEMLLVGVSVVGMESSCIAENLSIVPSPEKRIEFAKTLYSNGIQTAILIRPMFPKEIIPMEEKYRIVDGLIGNVSCILSGALMVNDHILDRLKIKNSDFNYDSAGDSEYLDGAMKDSIRFVDVRAEMGELAEYCKLKQIPFFEHSMPAFNYLYDLEFKIPKS